MFRLNDWFSLFSHISVVKFCLLVASCISLVKGYMISGCLEEFNFNILFLLWWCIPVLLQAYSCSADGTVRLWDFTDGILIKVQLNSFLVFSALFVHLHIKGLPQPISVKVDITYPPHLAACGRILKERLYMFHLAILKHYFGHTIFS